MASDAVEAPGRVWLSQARSDLSASARVLAGADATTFCQAIAKHQQAVEKAIKALASSVRDAGMASVRIKFSHGVDKMINALRRLHGRPERWSIQARVDRVLGGTHETEIAALMELAPRRPTAEDAPLPRNTEYPFHGSDGSWRAPADRGSFTIADVRRFDALANHIVRGMERVISAIDRLP